MNWLYIEPYSHKPFKAVKYKDGYWPVNPYSNDKECFIKGKGRRKIGKKIIENILLPDTTANTIISSVRIYGIETIGELLNCNEFIPSHLRWAELHNILKFGSIYENWLHHFIHICQMWNSSVMDQLALFIKGNYIYHKEKLVCSTDEFPSANRAISMNIMVYVYTYPMPDWMNYELHLDHFFHNLKAAKVIDFNDKYLSNESVKNKMIRLSGENITMQLVNHIKRIEWRKLETAIYLGLTPKYS